MKKLLIAANWKSNMSKSEAKTWLEGLLENKIPEYLEVVVFPPFTLIDNISGYIRVNDLFIGLGSQDVSPFDSGAYTGEVNAKQIKEFGDYVLIGHSERRSNFNETDETVNKKIEKSLEAGLKPIVCVSNLDQVKGLISGEFVIAYEPIGAIGTGNAENPQEASGFIDQIKSIKDTRVLYGGSVNSDNLRSYIDLPNVDGVLVGGQSLKADTFAKLIKNAT